MSLLSTRQWATIILVIITMIFFIGKKDVRRSLIDLVKKIFEKRLLVIWFIYFIYIFILTYFISFTPIWDNNYIIDIIIWSIFSGLINYINSFINVYDKKYISRLIKNNIGITIVFEYIMGRFTFSLLEELLLAILISVIFIVDLYNDNYVKDQKLSRYSNKISGYVGIFLTIRICLSAINQYKDINIKDELVGFMIPIVYLFLTLPLFYIMGLYSTYEDLFSYMPFNFKVSKEVKLRRYYKVIKTCLFSIDKLIVLKEYYVPKMYIKMTEEEFDNLLDRFQIEYENSESV